MRNAEAQILTVSLNTSSLGHSSSPILSLCSQIYSQLCTPPPNSNSGFSFQLKCDFHRKASNLPPQPTIWLDSFCTTCLLFLPNTYHNHRWIIIYVIICLKFAFPTGQNSSIKAMTCLSYSLCPKDLNSASLRATLKHLEILPRPSSLSAPPHPDHVAEAKTIYMWKF